MNKLNALGQSLIQRKEDLLTYKSHERIFNALVFQIEEQLVKTAVIDSTAEEMLINTEIDVVTFRNYLLATFQFLKSETELLEDFKALREDLIAELKRQELTTVTTDINIKGDKVSIFRTYVIDAEYVTEHFDVDEDKVNDLMQINGFVSKYAVLRLPKILKDFIKNYDDIPHMFTVTASKVFESEEPKGYSIDLVFDIKTNELENKDNIEHIVGYVKDIIQDCDEYFENRTSL